MHAFGFVLFFGLTCLTWSPGLASAFIDGVIGRLVELGQIPLAEYIQQELLVQKREFWRPMWLSETSLTTDEDIENGTRAARAGFTTASISQAMESYWAALKRGAGDADPKP